MCGIDLDCSSSLCCDERGIPPATKLRCSRGPLPIFCWNKEYTPLYPGLPLTTPEIEAQEFEIEVEEVASYLWQQPIDRIQEICDSSEGSEEFISTIAKESKCWNHEAIRQAVLQVKNEMITD